MRCSRAAGSVKSFRICVADQPVSATIHSLAFQSEGARSPVENVELALSRSCGISTDQAYSVSLSSVRPSGSGTNVERLLASTLRAALLPAGEVPAFHTASVKSPWTTPRSVGAQISQLNVGVGTPIASGS